MSENRRGVLFLTHTVDMMYLYSWAVKQFNACLDKKWTSKINCYNSSKTCHGTSNTCQFVWFYSILLKLLKTSLTFTLTACERWHCEHTSIFWDSRTYWENILSTSVQQRLLLRWAVMMIQYNTIQSFIVVMMMMMIVPGTPVGMLDVMWLFTVWNDQNGP